MARHTTTARVIELCAIAVAVLAGATCVAHFLPPRGRDSTQEPHGARRALQWSACVLLAALGLEPVRASLGPRAESVLAPLVADRRNGRDRERAGLTYYDLLLQRQGERTWTWGVPRFDPDDHQPFANTGFIVTGPPPIVWELAPLKRVRLMQYIVETNRHGMRDKDYEIAKPEHAHRLAILGSCVEMGVGVDNPEIFDELVETRLTRELGPRTARTYEILNFSAPGLSLLNQAFLLRERVVRFSPDVVLVSNHVSKLVDYLIQVMAHPRPWPPELTTLIEGAGLEGGMPEREMRRHLAPVQDEFDQWALAFIAEQCRAIGAVPVWLEVPDFELELEARIARQQRADRLRGLALSAGFRCVSVAAHLSQRDVDELTIPELGHCPNAAGHRWLAERLYTELVAQPQLLGEP